MQPNEQLQNTPNAALAFMAFSSVFGNINFQIQPPMAGKPGMSFPTVPYLSLEALLYQQQASNPATSPTDVISGTNVGQQAIAGQYTTQDASGTTRMLNGYQASGTP